MNTWKSWKIYKDDKTIFEKQKITEVLKPFHRIQGGIKAYRKETGFQGLVVNYGSEKIVCPLHHEELAKQMKVSRCWSCHKKKSRCLKKCSIEA